MKVASTPPQPPEAVITTPRRSLIGDIVESLVEVWTYRDLLGQLTRRDIKIRYKQSVMGFAWAILMPVLIVMAGVVIRIAMGYLAGTAVDTATLTGIAVKSLPWAFFVGAIGFANTSLVSNVNLVTKVYFPREVLPLSAVLAQAFDTLVATAALVVLLPFLGVPLSLTALWAIPLGITLLLFTAAVGLTISCANLFFRDVKYLVQVFITFGIFATPVFVEPAMFPGQGPLILMLNPLSPILEGLRLSIVEGHSLLDTLTIAGPAGPTVIWAPWYLGYAAAWALGGLAAGAVLFHRLEYLFAEYA